MKIILMLVMMATLTGCYSHFPGFAVKPHVIEQTTQERYRSKITGRFVSKEYARNNPSTVTVEKR